MEKTAFQKKWEELSSAFRRAGVPYGGSISLFINGREGLYYHQLETHGDGTWTIEGMQSVLDTLNKKFK